MPYLRPCCGQAKSIVEPFAYEEYRKNKIREKLEKERATRIQRKKLPKVNTQLAEKLLEGEGKRANLSNPLGDDRFAAMFTNPDFTIDQDSEVGGGGRLLCVSVCLFLCVCASILVWLNQHSKYWLSVFSGRVLGRLLILACCVIAQEFKLLHPVLSKHDKKKKERKKEREIAEEFEELEVSMHCLPM